MWALRRYQWYSSVALLSLLLAACGLQPATNRPGGPTIEFVSAQPTTAPATKPAATPQATLTPEEIDASAVLPAPLYFISAGDGQIWRVERDGATTRQITFEAAPVTYFDVSPVDSALAFVSGNTLYRANSDGSGRTTLLVGPHFNEDNRIASEITHPDWSPDGQRIAFGLNGVQVIEAAAGRQPNVIVASDPLPDFSDPNTPRPSANIRFYRHGIWSPDGGKLLAEFFYYPEGGGWAVLDLHTRAEVDLHSPGGIVCCNPMWSADSQWIYFSNDSIGLVEPGLWRAPASTGHAETLIDGVQGEPGQETFNLVSWARLLGDGQLYYFGATANEFPLMWPLPMAMTRSAPDVSEAVTLQAATYSLGEALWADDASGAVIMQLEASNQWPFHGPLLWLSSDGETVTLPVDGYALRWGTG